MVTIFALIQNILADSATSSLPITADWNGDFCCLRKDRHLPVRALDRVSAVVFSPGASSFRIITNSLSASDLNFVISDAGITNNFWGPQRFLLRSGYMASLLSQCRYHRQRDDPEGVPERAMSGQTKRPPSPLFATRQRLRLRGPSPISRNARPSRAAEITSKPATAATTAMTSRSRRWSKRGARAENSTCKPPRSQAACRP